MLFSDIPGHEHVKERLRMMVNNDRLPHALLLQGPAGVGKLAMARAFVQYNNCEHRDPNGDACGKCPSCLQMQSHNHIDALYSFPVVRPEGATNAPVSDDFFEEWKRFLEEDPFADFDRWTTMFGKNNARPIFYVTESNDLIHKLSFQSHGARYKSVILWLPERLNDESANKLLKIIEEPYEHTLIVMVSNAPEQILPTIYSRLQRIEMQRLPDSTVASWLVNHYGTDPSSAMALAHVAEGSISAAKRAASVNEESALQLEMFKQLMRMAYTRNVGALREWANNLAALGRERELKFYANAQRLVRENFMYNFSNPDLNFMTAEESAFSLNFARFITVDNVEKIIEVMDKAVEDISGNGNGKIINFDVSIKMILLLKHD